MPDNALSVLRRELCRLALRAAQEDIPLIIGGGVGLALRDEVLRSTRERTLRPYHPVRPTVDLDVFLTSEVITDASKVKEFRDIIADLGYEPVPRAQYYQFVKRLPAGMPLRDVKLDLLAAFSDSGRVKVKSRRIRPRGAAGLHAHVTPEAMTVEESPTPVPLACDDSEARVFVPHPFSYVILKLFAFRDRRHDPAKMNGTYHAFDIYNSLAMMTESQYEEGLELRDRFAEHQEFIEARKIGAEFFSSLSDLGLLRIREHLREVNIDEERVDLEGFLRDLGDLLGFAVLV